MIRSYERGWPIVLDSGQWLYKDTGLPIDWKRACKRCGQAPTDAGHDHCIGYVAGAASVCCGHGVSEPIYIGDSCHAEKSKGEGNARGGL